MPITLDGTLGITTPALTVTGATVNTGGISTAGNLTFTSTGNRITGDFSNATQSNRVLFQTSTTNGNTGVGIIPNGTGVITRLRAFNNSDPTNAGVLDIYADNTVTGVISGITGTGTYLPLTMYTNGSERLRIDTSGNVGIGTSSPICPLTIASSTTLAAGLPSLALQGGNNTERIAVYSSGVAGGTPVFLAATTRGTISSPTPIQANDVLGYFQLGGYNGTNYIRGAWISGFADGNWSGSNQGSIITFANTPNGSTTITERMRIDSSGNVGIGTTSYQGRLTVVAASNATYTAQIRSDSSGDIGQAPLLVTKYDNNSTTSQVFQRFAINQGGTANGQINSNGASAVAFGSWSDRRLKENIEPLPAQLDNILALKPCEFDYKAGGHQIGFIAQEMQEVYPDVVGEDVDGMLTITGWDKTTARLVKAIQEQQVMIEELKAKVAALEAN